MSPEEAADSMLKQGSTEVAEFKNLKVGSRIRRAAEQWGAAYTNGTGTIERIFHKRNSSWEQKYGRPDVELIVLCDDGHYSYLADYHIELAEVQP
jgi:hypothetical protein